MMENHTYDSLFGRYPLNPNGGVATLPQAANPFPGDIDHTGPRQLALLQDGLLDQVSQAGQVQYFASDVPVYWSYAQNFGLGDNFFSSMATNSQPNHLALIAGQTAGEYGNGGDCTSPANAVEIQRAASGIESFAYPCYNISTVPQTLSQYGISWRYYSNGGIWDAPKNVTNLYVSPNNVINPDQFLADVQSGNMPAVSWVNPAFSNSDHPPENLSAGQDFVSQEVSAIMQSQYWNNTVIFVTWDDWGGFYDHVNPTALDADGLGLRAPLLVISPYTKPGYISHNLGEFASFLKFIELNWGLPNLGQRDSLPMISDLTDYFDYSQTPLAPVTEPNLPFSTVLSASTGNPLTPAIGTVKTTFNYTITYTSKVTPSVANVIIDGVAFPMTKGTSTGGASVYKYSTTLGTGTHNYTFAFTDSNGTWAIPDNNTTYPGPMVGPFTLDNNAVSQGSAMPGQAVTYSVRYTSIGNTAPTRAQIQLDGIAYDLAPSGPLTYKNGVTYTYTTSSLAIGGHSARYVFDDGTGPRVLEAGELPIVSPIIVTGPGVSPATGTTSTTFAFNATYTSVDGSDPTNGASVTIDGATFPMTYVSGSSSTGAAYQYTTTLGAGTHTYFFYFANASAKWASPIYPSNFSMTVTSGASTTSKPAGSSVGHTVVSPSHSEDPDQTDYQVDPVAGAPQSQSQPPTDDDD
jgi:phospholipase C